MKKLTLIFSFTIVLMGCNKKTSTPIVTPQLTQTNSNHYTFKIGTTNYTTPDIYGQPIFTQTDTILIMNAYNNIDTISGGFSLHAPTLGTYTHTNFIGSYDNSFIVNFGNSSNPTSTFYSKSGTITITTYDKVSNTYAGTFSGIMYLSTNPSYTLPLTNGSFYYKYQ